MPVGTWLYAPMGFFTISGLDHDKDQNTKFQFPLLEPVIEYIFQIRVIFLS